MKTSIFPVIFLLGFNSIYSQASRHNGIQIILQGNIDTHQNVLGLSSVEYLVLNNTNEPVRISGPERWAFTASIGENNIEFSQREISTFNEHYILIGPNDSLRLTANLNLFDLQQKYQVLTGRIITSPIKVEISASINCYNNGILSSCHSLEKVIVVNPLKKIDQEAFEYILSLDYSPYDLTSRAYITAFGINKTIADAILLRYPTSTFAELVSLSSAFSKSREKIFKPQEKKELEQQLEFLLRSEFSFVRYLAEALHSK